ncbi:DUF3301 domain-containing protein [uncultured Thiohalocapsa sp.]|uniref:DUF3301 domain-containing protein n=1 Tax=uncultured Thiohalocapsa sp. TaxID=768990 RepID=UPI0025FD5B2E|nr:DUF3301 domain-containing protein [uncultured Thiohalocapsa sp.]
MSLTIDSLLGLLVILLTGWLWLNTLRARELALVRARRACERAGVQLLDQAVALRGMGLVWTPRGLRLRRRYGFEFSADGVARRAGQLILLGLSLESLWLQTDPTDTGQVPDEHGAARGRCEP